jgi:hypothetical protein
MRENDKTARTELHSKVSVTPSTPSRRTAFLINCFNDWKRRSPWAEATKW